MQANIAIIAITNLRKSIGCQKKAMLNEAFVMRFANASTKRLNRPRNVLANHVGTHRSASSEHATMQTLTELGANG